MVATSNLYIIIGYFLIETMLLNSSLFIELMFLTFIYPAPIGDNRHKNTPGI
uniref:Uncharacterized protein n=2 Tax=Anguilla anguilla TaxID=7936 RepID=A0A0E9P991_ANGAN